MISNGLNKERRRLCFSAGLSGPCPPEHCPLQNIDEGSVQRSGSAKVIIGPSSGTGAVRRLRPKKSTQIPAALEATLWHRVSVKSDLHSGVAGTSRIPATALTSEDEAQYWSRTQLRRSMTGALTRSDRDKRLQESSQEHLSAPRVCVVGEEWVRRGRFESDNDRWPRRSQRCDSISLLHLQHLTNGRTRTPHHAVSIDLRPHPHAALHASFKGVNAEERSILLSLLQGRALCEERLGQSLQQVEMCNMSPPAAVTVA
uniref:Uncharacterized protein n=1 Tax=Knipowitschia caucasica TaxID=637954 RepID=A0AAV2JPP0_KNICA